MSLVDTAQAIKIVSLMGLWLLILGPFLTAMFVKSKKYILFVGILWFVIAANVFIARSVADPLLEYVSSSMLEMENDYIDAELNANIIIEHSDDKNLRVVVLPLSGSAVGEDVIPLPIPNFVRLRLGVASWSSLTAVYVIIFWLISIECMRVLKSQK